MAGFSSRLRMIRKIKGISVSELARKSGLTTSQIYSYEKDKTLPSVLSASKLSKALGVDLQLLTGPGYKYTSFSNNYTLEKPSPVIVRGRREFV